MGKQVKYLPEDDLGEQPLQKAVPMKVSEDDDDLGAQPLKKKGNTTEEPKQNSGTTTPGSPVSKEPGTKEEQPSSKSTEDKYFEAYGEKLQKQKSDKYLQTLQSDVDNFAKTLPLDRTSQKSVDQYNAKLTEYHNKRSKELADQTDKELQSEYSSEFERVKAQSEKFNSQLGKFQEARQPQEKESALTRFVQGDAFLAPITSVLFDAIPSAIASSKVNAKPFAQHVYDNNVGIPIEKVASTAEDKQKVFKDAEDKYRKKVGDEQFEREKSLYSIEQTNQTLEAFKEMSAQDRDRQLKLKGIPQEWADAKGVSGVFLYGLSSVAEVAGQIPASIATLGTSTYFMERGDILKGGIEEAATAKGVSPETFIKSYPEELTKISEIADQYGAANAALDLISLGTGIGMVAKKAIGTKLMKDIMVRPGMKALINVAQVPGKAAGAGIMEGFTEGWQETNTIIAGKISSGEAKDYADGFNKLNDEDKDRIEEAARKGGFAGAVLAGGGSAITQQARVDKYNTITKERASRKFEAPPAPPVKVMSVADVIKQAAAPITSTEDTPKIEEAAATIIESTKNEGTASEPVKKLYNTPALVLKTLNPEGSNPIMSEEDAGLIDAKVEKIIETPRTDLTDTERLPPSLALGNNEILDLQTFINERRAGRETRSFAEWRRDTRGTTTTQATGEPIQQVAEGQEQQGSTQVLTSTQRKQNAIEKYKDIPDSELEKKQLSIEENFKNATPKEQDEFNDIDNELQRREWGSVFDKPLSEASEVIDGLMQKEKDQPNGYGAYIDKKDASESKQVVEKYSNPESISDQDVKKDFKNALMGRPSTWYADGLRLRESANLAAKRGIEMGELLAEVENEFIKDGYDAQTAKDVIAGYLAKINPVASQATGEPVQQVAERQEQQGSTPAVQQDTPETGQVGTGESATVLEKPTQVADSTGKPITVYHGTTGDVSSGFTPKSMGTHGNHEYFYFAKDKKWVENFKKEEPIENKDQFKIGEYNLDIKNPLDLTNKFFTVDDWIKHFQDNGINPSQETIDFWKNQSQSNPRQTVGVWQLIRMDNGKFRKDLIDGGYDGLIISDKVRGRADNTVYVALKNDQIKPKTGEAPSKLTTESKSPEAPVQEEQVSGQGVAVEPDLTLGTNFQKVSGAWQVKQADGTWAPVINKNATKEQQNQELKHLKEIQAQLEAQEPQNLKMSNTEKYNIKQLPVNSARSAVRKFFWGKGKVLWNTKEDNASSKPRKGIKEHGGLRDSEKNALNEYVDDQNGLSVEQIAENLTDQYKFEVTASDVVDVLAHTDPKNWYADHFRESDDYLLGAASRHAEMDKLATDIAEIEAQEQATQETNKQLYENERRVNTGSNSEGNGQTAGNNQPWQETGTGTAGEGNTAEQGQERGRGITPGESGETASESIRKNGDEAKSKQALKDLEQLEITHVSGLGMGQNQAKGMYLSTDKEGNRYQTPDKTAKKVRVKIKNPFVTTIHIFADIQRKVIQARLGKKSIDEIAEDPQSDTMSDLLAEMMTEHFVNEGYDAIYFPQSESEFLEGELVVFDRENVEFMRDWTSYDEAVHQASQVVLATPPIKNSQFMKSDKSVELNIKYKKLREQLRTLNKLVNCR